MKTIKIIINKVEVVDGKEKSTLFDTWPLRLNIEGEITAAAAKEFASAEVLGWSPYKGIVKLNDTISEKRKKDVLADDKIINDIHFVEYTINVKFEEVPVVKGNPRKKVEEAPIVEAAPVKKSKKVKAVDAPAEETPEAPAEETPTAE